MKASRCLGAWAALYLHWEDPQESFLQLLSCSWLSSCKSRFKSDFSQLLFPGIPVAAAAVHFSWSPFSGRGLSFSPAAPSHSLSYSSPSPTLSSLPNFPAATSQAQPLSLRSQAGGSWLCLCSSLPILERHHLPACAERDPWHIPAWSCPTLHTCPEHFVSAESPTERGTMQKMLKNNLSILH